MPLLHSIILVLSLTAAIGYGINVRETPSVPRMITKTSAIGLLALLSATLHAPRLLIAAQAFGALGDAFLAWDDDGSFLRGLGSFLTAHIFYITLFINSANGWEILLSGGWRAFAAAFMLLLASGMVVILLPRVSYHLRVPILVYSIAIYAMVLTALTVDNTRLISGAIIFTASDSLLATEKFLVSHNSSHRAWMEHAVWVLYYFGQLLIMLGLLNLA
ncbi:Lysoplasmalogenase [Fusarium albosuccineum]|uniref:Lysoplasmalogenase n=1 Tax=Fusarium albosuccineum TaxID=1237068 RepID=A0A8H4KY90_9HYPO|nr:Lysoplasmalogenase [Fusarium albosuccineum]